MATTTSDRYTIISADTHAARTTRTYRQYLDPAFHDDFDACGQVQEPVEGPARHRLRVRNWDDTRRSGDQFADGIVASDLPNTVPPSIPASCCSPAAEARGVRAPPRRHPRAQPLARRLLRAASCATRRHRAVLPQRHRRRIEDITWIRSTATRRRAAADRRTDVKW